MHGYSLLNFELTAACYSWLVRSQATRQALCSTWPGRVSVHLCELHDLRLHWYASLRARLVL